MTEDIFVARASFLTIFGALERGFQGTSNVCSASHFMYLERRASIPKAPVRSQRNDPAEPLGEVGLGDDVASVPAGGRREFFLSVPLDRAWAAFSVSGVCRGLGGLAECAR